MGNNTAEQKVTPRSRDGQNQSPGCTALMYACQQGDVNQVEKLLKINASLARDKDRTYKTALHYCAETRTAQCADLVYRAAPDLINAADEDGLTPLHLAVIAGNIPFTNFLLANNADVGVLDNERHSVVHWATVCGETAALRSVLLANAPVSTPDVHGGFPLHYAAQMCGAKDPITAITSPENRIGSDTSKLGLEVLDALLTFPGIRINVEDGDGRQPLLWAASAGSASAVLALIAAGSAPEGSDKDGLTALHCAASRGHTDCLETLLSMCGVAPDVIDTNGCTALHYAVTLGHADATALLLAHGAKVNRQDRKGRTPAHCGCAKGQVETVRMLGAHGADLWLRSARGDLPLHEAASAGRRQLVRWLLAQRPSQINATNNDGRTPLHVASLHDNTDICKILIDHGANVNAIMTTSKNVLMTPLDCALKNGFRSTAKFLQLNGGLPFQRLRMAVTPTAGISVMVENDIVIRSSDHVTVGGETNSADFQTYRQLPKKKVIKRKRKVRVEETRGISRNQSRQFSSSSLSSDSAIMTSTKPIRTRTKESQTDEKFILVPIDNDQFLMKPLEETSEPNEERESSASKWKDTVKEIAAKIIDVELKPKLKQEIATDVAEEKVVENLETLNSVAEESKDLSLNNGRSDSNLSDQSGVQPNATEVITEVLIHQEAERNEIETEGKSVEEVNEESNSVEGSKEEELSVIENKVEQSEVDGAENVEGESNAKDERVEEIGPVEEAGEKVEQIAVEPANEGVLEEVQTIPDDQVNGDETHEEKLEVGAEVEVQDSNILSEDKQEHGSDMVNGQLVGGAIIDVSIVESKGEDVIKDKGEENIETASNVVGENIEGSKESKDTNTPDKVVGPLSLNGEVSTEQTSTEKGIEKNVEDEATKPENSSMSEDKSETIIETKVVADISQSSTVSPSKDAAAELKETAAEIPESSTVSPPKDAEAELKETADFLTNQTGVESKEAFIVISKTSGDDSKAQDRALIKVLSDSDIPKGVQATSQAKVSDIMAESSASPSSSADGPTVPEVPMSSPDGPVDPNDQNGSKFKSFAIISDPISKRKRLKRTKSEVLPDSDDEKSPTKPGGWKPKKASSLQTPIRSERKPSRISEKSASTDTEDDPAIKTETRSRRRRSKIEELIYSDDSDFNIRRQDSEQTKRSKSVENSDMLDSGFEPSPRSSRIPRRRACSTKPEVNMTTVTQTVQANIRRYHLERKLFHHLLELKRLQIRSGVSNEAVLVKRAIDEYHRSILSTVGGGRYTQKDFTFKSFEKFLYDSLRKLQKTQVPYLAKLPETPALLCTHPTMQCDHATHAYTGIPCAAYITKLNHHTIPKVGFGTKPGGFLPKIRPKANQKGVVTLELTHGTDKQFVTLPAEKLDYNKKYYVTFTVKGQGDGEVPDSGSHRHAKSC